MALTNINTLLAVPCGTMMSYGTVAIDAVEEHVAFVLTVPKTGTLKKIGWRVYSVSSPNMTVRVSIETVADAVGVPVATSDAGKTLYATGAVSADITSLSPAIRYDSINSTNGITVTKGDLISVVIRCISYTSGSITIVIDPYAKYGGCPNNSSVTLPYTYAYLNDAGSGYYTPIVALEYDDGFVPVLGCYPPYVPTNLSWNSGSTPDRCGLAITPAVTMRVVAVGAFIDADSDTDIIVYDSDAYTVLDTLAIDKDKRRGSSSGMHIMLLSSPLTLQAGSTYRVICLPKTTTNINLSRRDFTNDGSILGITALPEGTSCIYTYRNGAPSSGDKTWTDNNTQVPIIYVLADQIDIGSGGGGSSPRFGDMTGGLR